MTWKDVILPERTKRELRQMQLLLEKPGLSKDLGIEPPTGLLLYGPPGTGKTTIARVLAHESKCRFFATTPAEVNSMWLGESEKQVARLFAQARANAPSIVFLDEIDALLPSRTGGINQYSDKVVNQFLHEMDGLNKNNRIFVIGATNRRDMLDPALLRGGRLSREIEIPLPDLAARIALFELNTRNARLDDSVDKEALAERTDGYSGANIKALVNEAGLQALIRLADSPDEDNIVRKLSAQDFEEALLNFKPPKEDPPNPWKMFG
jgi:transitional endoplasmic reticulum ATPase